MQTQMKYVKLSLAALAVVALVVGLAVGLAPRTPRADGASVSVPAANYVGTVAAGYADECEYDAKSAKGGRLVVPGTADDVRGRQDGRLRELGIENALASAGTDSGSKSAKAAGGSKSDKEAEAKSSKCHTHLSCKFGESDGSKSAKGDIEVSGGDSKASKSGESDGSKSAKGDIEVSDGVSKASKSGESDGSKSAKGDIEVSGVKADKGSKTSKTNVPPNVGSKSGGESKASKADVAAPAPAPSLCGAVSDKLQIK